MKKTVFALALMLAAPLHAAELRIATSFSILADIVRQIGGERVEVTEPVGPNGDLHAWQPRPSDARLVKEADLVIIHGLGLDTQFARLADSVEAPQVVVASTGVTPLAADDNH